MSAPPPRSRSSIPAMHRKRRLVLAGVVALVVTVAVFARLILQGGGPSAPAVVISPPSTTQLKLVAKRAPRPLPAPVSGESVTATAGAIYVMGGLDGAEQLAGGIFRLDPHTARLSAAGNLTGPIHDAASTALAGRVLVIGGGTSTSTAAVQGFTPGQDARPVGRLPTARSDLAAVTLGEPCLRPRWL